MEKSFQDQTNHVLAKWEDVLLELEKQIAFIRDKQKSDKQYLKNSMFLVLEANRIIVQEMVDDIKSIIGKQ